MPNDNKCISAFHENIDSISSVYSDSVCGECYLLLACVMLGAFIVDQLILLGTVNICGGCYLFLACVMLGACKRLFDVHLSMIGIVYVRFIYYD